MAHQGFPPRRSSGLPQSGQPEAQRRPEAQRHADAQPYPDGAPGSGGQSRPDPGPDERTRRAGHGGSRPRTAARPARGEREAWLRSDPFTASDEAELPPWAGPAIYATKAGGRQLRPPAPELDAPAADGGEPAPRRRGRAAAARLRKSRRRVYVWCGTAIALAVIVAVIAVIHGLPKSAPHSSFITTLQPGEFRSVPSACTVVSPALLSQYLPGTARKVTPAGTGGANSQCTFTVDSKPVFRVLGITVQAYQPSLVAPGNGSATANAQDAFLAARQQLAHPPRKSPLPAAQVTQLVGLGQQAFSAFQVIRVGHSVNDRVTVTARDHNVIVTVSFEAQASGGGFGPVSIPTLRVGTVAVSRGVIARAVAEPTVKG